ncbi:MAG: PAS domain S-box protein [Comamonas sp.]
MLHTNRQAAGVTHRRVSLVCASLVLGLGIWVMHFIGMLAMELPLPVSYATELTVLSVLPGMVAAWLALRSLQQPHPSGARIALSGLWVGLGTAAMHYSGLRAMQLDAQVYFDAPLFMASIFSGLGFSMVAFFLQQWIDHRKLYASHWSWRLLPPLLLTLAIASMHYLSMLALRISTVQAQSTVPQGLDSAHTLSILLVAVSLVVFLVLGLANALLRYRDLWQAVTLRDARLEALMTTSVDGMITIDAKGHIGEFNPAAERIFGYTKEEVLGRNVSMLMPSPLAEQHDGYLHKHQSNPELPIGVKAREVLGKRKDGRHMPLQLSIGKAVTSTGTVFVGFLQDITSRKRADAQLRIAASVFQHVREGVAIVDANHNISDANPAFLRLMELERETCIGRSLDSLYEDVEMATDLSQLWPTVMAAKYWQGEILCTRLNGTAWIQRLSISPVLNEQQRPQHYIAVISDVSERPSLDLLLSHTDLHDRDTDLPSAKLLQDRLHNGLRLKQHNRTHLAVLIVQLQMTAPSESDSTTVDLTAALRLVGQILQTQLRNSDTLARWQTEQLAIVLPGIVGDASFEHIVARIRQRLYDVQGDCQNLGVQALLLGASCTQFQGASPNDLLQHAQKSLAPVQHRTAPTTTMGDAL